MLFTACHTNEYLRTKTTIRKPTCFQLSPVLFFGRVQNVLAIFHKKYFLELKNKVLLLLKVVLKCVEKYFTKETESCLRL